MSALRERVAACRAAFRTDTDRGSGAAAVIIFAFLFLALAGFVVDGGLSISQRERAADIAEQAARYAAQDLDVEALRNAPAGTKPQINFKNCDTRVREFAAAAGLTGGALKSMKCSVATADRIEVNVDLTYTPILSGFFYSEPLTAHGTAAAEPATGPAN
ncbi:pilus assembly protein TadG-related protein [Streptomyces sp. H10-C2]|uniref:Tad domain-containing protein n=1 Tax=unclassified Streptomyces TaxID=2593676 RepID=UPI0024BB99F7|nr:MULTISPECIES: pilus assembly protein TadG-related protein [unclassified Streptomyces]MDJ0342478.1 pilus assembly protein TadG-related protein [Streptomyces sp. PH10-H1]MDJ0372333.1 pilus assembly protein TadG-related protein [Streptomyces sp. H10-C2]